MAKPTKFRYSVKKHFTKHFTNLKKVLLSPLQTFSPSSAELERCTLENTPKFTFETQGKVPCKILDIYDGDTLDVAMDHYGKNYSFRIRLEGIDTPELKPALNIANRDKIVELGFAAKTYLESLILNKVVFIEITGLDKYGRLLGKIYLPNGETVNDSMIRSGHAVFYDGGKKTL